MSSGVEWFEREGGVVCREVSRGDEATRGVELVELAWGVEVSRVGVEGLVWCRGRCRGQAQGAGLTQEPAFLAQGPRTTFLSVCGSYDHNPKVDC